MCKCWILAPTPWPFSGCQDQDGLHSETPPRKKDMFHHCRDFHKKKKRVWCLLSRPKSQNTEDPRCKAAFFLGILSKSGMETACFLVDTEEMLCLECLNVDIPMIFFLITKPAIKIPQFAQGINRIKLLSSWANRWRKLEDDHDLTEFWKALSFTTIISCLMMSHRDIKTSHLSHSYAVVGCKPIRIS